MTAALKSAKPSGTYATFVDRVTVNAVKTMVYLTRQGVRPPS